MNARDEYVRHDMHDLFESWQRALDEIRANPTPENVRKSFVRFEEIDAYVTTIDKRDNDRRVSA